ARRIVSALAEHSHMECPNHPPAIFNVPGGAARSEGVVTSGPSDLQSPQKRIASQLSPGHPIVNHPILAVTRFRPCRLLDSHRMLWIGWIPLIPNHSTHSMTTR